MAFRVEYKKAMDGWIEIALHGENGSFDIDISEVFDPFEDWFYALERVYRHETPSIVINPEGKTLRIDFIDLYLQGYGIRVVHHVSNELLFFCITTKEEIVAQMYGGLMAFIRSDAYDPLSYEKVSHSSGFPLKNYCNDTLERYLVGNIFDDNAAFTRCRYCQQSIEVKTIDDMLERAYDIIDKDPKTTLLLQNLGLNKFTVGISQEYSRHKALSKPYCNFSEDYRPVQGSEAELYLAFNENFTVLEAIEISPTFFSENYIRGYTAQFNTHSLSDKMLFLEKAFAEFHPQLAHLSSYLEVKEIEKMANIEITLKIPNERMLTNYASAFYPNPDTYPYFSFSINHKEKNGRLDKIMLCLAPSSYEPIDEPISKWLHQSTVSMYPDYGDVYLWFAGAAGDIESLEGYDFQGGELATKFEDWYGEFRYNASVIDADWEAFNETGHALFLELKERIKDNYILMYAKSFEETYGTQVEREQIKKNALS